MPELAGVGSDGLERAWDISDISGQRKRVKVSLIGRVEVKLDNHRLQK